MSVEPTSVSKPVVRESETVSSNSWNFLQGGRTGTKEGQFNSFWDKAVHGAQKLLGIDSKNEEESADEETRAGSRSNSKPEGTGNRLASTPGFGNAGFGSIAHSVRRDSINTVQFGQTDRTFENVEKSAQDFRPADSGADLESAEPKLAPKEKAEAPEQKPEAKEKPKSDTEPEAKDETSEDASEEGGEKEAKTAMPAPNAVLGATKRGTVENSLNADSKQVKEGEVTLGTEGAQNGLQMRSLATDKGINAESTSASNVPNGQAKPVSEGTKVISIEVARLASEGQKVPQQEQAIAPIAQTTSKSVAGPQLENAESQKAASQQASKPAVSQGPVSENSPKLVKAEGANPQVATDKPLKLVAEKPQEGEILSFDAEKAKADVSDALKRAPRQARVAQTPLANQNQAQPAVPTNGNVIAADANAGQAPQAKPEAQGDLVEFKGNQNLETQRPGVKGSANPSKGQVPIGQPAVEVAKANLPSQTAVAGEANAAASSQRAAAHAADSQSAAAARSADARSAAANRGKSVAQPISQPMGGVNGLQAGATAQANPGAGTQSQGQGQSFENAPKQDAASVMKQSASTAAKADKGSNDGQSFSLQNASETSSRRGQAAEKAAPTSYSSKSAEEVKETFQVFSKGIEKMIAAKQNTFTVRINFDQGGSMALKVTMENGQVNSQMQTDLPGLEGMIKQNWSELANDWNTKGVKLNVPQFSTEGGDARGDNNSFMSFDQQRDARNALANGNGQQGRGSNTQGGGSDASGKGEATSTGAQNEESEEVVSDTELKTYA